MASNKLEQAAIAKRDELIAINKFDNVANSNNYTATHTRALSDSQTPVHGKGNPNDGSIESSALGGGYYNISGPVGGSYDINGSPSMVGSGRIGNVTKNSFNFNVQYQHPDTSLNIGQVTF